MAVVLPNGPEAAVAFLSVSSAATAATLNPGYRRNEFEFYLADLGAFGCCRDLDVHWRVVESAILAESRIGDEERLIRRWPLVPREWRRRQVIEKRSGAIRRAGKRLVRRQRRQIDFAQDSSRRIDEKKVRNTR